jgi:hypothetical protein
MYARIRRTYAVETSDGTVTTWKFGVALLKLLRRQLEFDISKKVIFWGDVKILVSSFVIQDFRMTHTGRQMYMC